MATRAKTCIVKPKSFSAHIDSVSPEPTTVVAAFASPQWTQAMNDEYRALITNGTWTLTSLPSGANLVGYKWIFKHKFNVDGSFQRHKARLVAKGYNQPDGLDYLTTFSLVVKPTTIRLCLLMLFHLTGPFIKSTLTMPFSMVTYMNMCTCNNFSRYKSKACMQASQGHIWAQTSTSCLISEAKSNSPQYWLSFHNQ